MDENCENEVRKKSWFAVEKKMAVDDKSRSKPKLVQAPFTRARVSPTFSNTTNTKNIHVPWSHWGGDRRGNTECDSLLTSIR